MNRLEKIRGGNRFNRNRSLEVSEFRPETQEEHLIHEIAKAIGEKDVRYLKSILDRFGYALIERAYTELREAMAQKRDIRSMPKFFNYLVEKQRKGGDKSYEQRKYD